MRAQNEHRQSAGLPVASIPQQSPPIAPRPTTLSGRCLAIAIERPQVAAGLIRRKETDEPPQPLHSPAVHARNAGAARGHARVAVPRAVPENLRRRGGPRTGPPNAVRAGAARHAAACHCHRLCMHGHRAGARTGRAAGEPGTPHHAHQPAARLAVHRRRAVRGGRHRARAADVEFRRTVGEPAAQRLGGEHRRRHRRSDADAAPGQPRWCRG